jgi:SAM-dependent methyltransferase
VTNNERNTKLEDHRMRLWSPKHPGRKMSRAELATAVNRKLAQLYPGKRSLRVTARWIKDLELGVTSWPGAQRRKALRIVLGASSDARLGLFDSHPRSGDPIGNGTATPPAADRQPVDTPAQVPTVRRPVTGGSTGHPGQEVDWTRPQTGRVYDYLLGGKDHRPPDRMMGDDLLAAFPTAREAAAQTRAFLERTVQMLAASGIRQFLDIGAGIPRPGCTHETAQAIASDCRVVYVDHDPVVMQHVRARHVSHPAGRVDHVQADLLHPQAILDSTAVRDTFDWHQPIAVLLGAVVHHIPDDEDATTAIKKMLAPMPLGSALVISHATIDFSHPEQVAAYEQMHAVGRIPVRARTASAIRNFLHGLELIDPGLVPIAEWHPDPSEQLPAPERIGMYGAVGWIR